MTTLRSFATSVVATAWVGRPVRVTRPVADGATQPRRSRRRNLLRGRQALPGDQRGAGGDGTAAAGAYAHHEPLRNLAAPQLTAVFVAFGLAFLLAIAAFNSNAPVPFMSPLRSLAICHRRHRDRRCSRCEPADCRYASRAAPQIAGCTVDVADRPGTCRRATRFFGVFRVLQMIQLRALASATLHGHRTCC